MKQLEAERQGVTPKSKALTPEQQKIQELEARINRLEREKAILKGYRSLDVGRTRSYALIDQLSEQESVEVVCSAFDVARSCYYVHRLRRRRVDARRVALRSQVNQLFSQSRGSAGSRSILGMLREEGVTIGRFRVRRLMRELGLVSKQPGSHAYKQATVERPDIPNRLNREFATEHPNQVWCGDITYVWAQGRWHYLAAVLDLHTRRVIGWAFSAAGCRTGDQGPGHGLRTARQATAGAVPFRPGQPVRQPPVSATALALSDAAEHESPRELLG